ncbi:MAG TPA: DNA mismatch repair endonuclease MutL [Anaerolineaceae bacterium]|nr:DNA mismatch repair endonuclease MutL [Anaerolineaceae bacterium]
MHIQRLPDDVASQIAAGEVVERPASVVKELVENALDAGASQIVIRIEQAGKSLIEVADDGRGIPLEDLDLAVTKHATSKLRTAEDLFHIQTLGFRGEALASIGSISRLTLISRTAEQKMGGKIIVDGGKLVLREQIGAPVGTIIQVQNMFYNVPARLKFLKRDSTERQQIENFISRYAIAYPLIRFLLVVDGKNVFQTNGKGNQREIVAQLYGIDLARQMLEVNLEEDDLQIRGLISPISLTRSNRKEITFFINGRWVQDTPLISALLQAYHTLLMVGRYPMAVLFIELPPEDVDVNVHPAKAEVRFRNPDRLFSTVQRAIRRALMAHSPVPIMQSSGWQSPRLNSWEGERIPDPAWQMQIQTPSGPLSSMDDTAMPGKPDEQSAPQASPIPSGQIPLLRLIGQVGGVYLVAEGPDGIYLIDQHAAHERVLFEKLMHQQGSLVMQPLLSPIVIHLPPAQSSLLAEQLVALSHLGFQVDEFGTNTFRIHSIPAMFSTGDPAAAIRSLVEDFEEDETPFQEEIETKIAARVCKRMAVKAGQAMALEEQKALIRELEACESPRTCPHGRPTMILLSVDLLERQFGRRGSR